MMDGRNPCDVCESRMCEDLFYDCVFDIYGATKYECANWECFMNYDGSCAVSAYDKCGAWKE